VDQVSRRASQLSEKELSVDPVGRHHSLHHRI